MTIKAENMNITSYINLILIREQRVFIIFSKFFKHQLAKIRIHVKQAINISY